LIIDKSPLSNQPPELFQAKLWNMVQRDKLDVYQFGILAIFITTKKLPLVELEQAVAEELISKGEILKDLAVPPTFLPWITTCLSTAPATRPSISELMAIAFP
jgi:hypothetical protein